MKQVDQSLHPNPFPNGLRDLAYDLPGVLFRLDADLKIQSANQALADVSGRPLDELLGKPFYSLVSAPDSAACQAYLTSIQAGQAFPPTIDVRLDQPGWPEQWQILRARPISGGPELAGTLNDVTERRILEMGMHRNDEALRTLYSITTSQHLSLSEKLQALLVMGTQHFGMDVGFLSDITSNRFEIREVYGPGFTYSAGTILPIEETYSQEILRAGGLIEILHAAEATGWAQHPAYLRHHFESYIGVPVIIGSQVYGTLSFASPRLRPNPYTSSEKEFLRLMALWMGSEIGQDISTGQLQRYTAEIDRINQALAAARDQALEAASIKSEFVATISHEIRTPISAIVGMTDLLLETPLSNYQKEYASVVRDSAEMLLALINDILDFSKIEAGKLTLESIPFKPLELMESVIDMFAPSAYEKGLEIAACMYPSVPETLMGDPTRLRQVLANLIGNGIKFTNSGHIALTVKRVIEDTAEIRLKFEVADTGIGLSTKAREHLFQPFTQADGSISRVYGGTGLGLAISRRLVEAMHGEISVESVEGKGSKFWFTAAFSAEDILPQVRGVPSLEDYRILLAVDDNAVYVALRTYLQAHQAVVSTVALAQSILPILSDEASGKEPFTHVIVDLADPDWNSIRLCQEIRSNPAFNSLHVIALVAYSERALQDLSGSPECVEILAKPVKKASLMEAVLRSAESLPVESARETPPQDVPVDQPLKQIHQSAPYVLLAEDNQANLRLATIQLQKLGYRVETAASGRQAIELLMQTNHKFSLVLMDCQMPDVDGFSATRIIRKSELSTGRHIPIIAMTASVLPGDREKCLSAGMDDYLTKPITMELLRSVLTRWIEAGPITGPIVIPEIGLEPVHVLPPPLDAASLQTIRSLQTEDQLDFLSELIDIYLRESSLHMQSIRESSAKGLLDDLRRAAHSLRGASSNLGAHALAAFLSELEKQATFGFVEDSAGILNNIEEEYARVLQAMQIERKPSGEKPSQPEPQFP